MHRIFRELKAMRCPNIRPFQTLPKIFKISNEVKEQIASGGPVVALESTIITHGMPFPENLSMALQVEEIIKNHQALPATVGIMNGKVYIGMNQEQLKALASQKENVLKISRRDLPYVLSKEFSGGTTVAATMALAYKAGIKLFVTGGIGGVHKGGENTMDISADLLELAHTPMNVISAGVKSILDIGRTLEFLETHGVCVATFGSSREFPAFFTSKSGFFSPCNVETVEDAAQLINSRDSLGLETGMLIAVPIPEDKSADGEVTENAINQALSEAHFQKISGRDITPFVLKRINELSCGASLRAKRVPGNKENLENPAAQLIKDVSLIENNAKIGSLIAVELARIQATSEQVGKHFQAKPEYLAEPKQIQYKIPEKHNAILKKSCNGSLKRPVVIGGTILDITATVLEEKLQLNGNTHTGRLQISCGGVGRNIADCLTHLRLQPVFISAVGDDSSGDTVLSKMEHMETNAIRRISGASTAVYTAILDKNGECLFGVGEMEVHKTISVQQVKTYENALSQAPLVAIDGNMPLDTMDYVLGYCASNEIPVWFEPTDANKAAKPFKCKSWTTPLDYASPNLNELREMNNALSYQEKHSTQSNEVYDAGCALEECLRLSLPLMRRVRTLLVTLGSQGVVLITSIPRESPFQTKKNYIKTQKGCIRAIHYPAPRPSDIVSVSGAGDCLAAAVMAAIVEDRWTQDCCIRAGLNAAYLSLGSFHPVPSSIQPDTVFTFENFLPRLRSINLFEE